MASNLSQASVLKTYRIVIEETIASSREAFLDEGIDEQVLLELKQLWETKVANSKAVQIDLPIDTEATASTSNTTRKAQSVKRNNNDIVSSTTNNYSQNVIAHAQTSTVSNGGGAPAPPAPVTVPVLPIQPTQQVQSTSTVPAMFTNMLDPNKVVPIQITLPPQPGLQETQGRVLTIQVPAAALIGNQLQQVLTGPAISATMGLPQPQASNLLQQHVNAALQGQNSPLLAAKAIPQMDGALDDTSDEEDDVGSEEPSEDEDIDDDKEDEDPDMDDTGMEEEPLNSEDDVSEEDPSDLFDTDNVVVCQYDKINRSRNKWKFYLKDGIMNLNGKDFIFQKITGDAEW